MVYNATDQSSIMLAMSGTHPGFVQGAAAFAKTRGWHLVMDPVLTGSIPLGWRGAGIIVEEGYNRSLVDEALSLKIPCVAISYGQGSGVPIRVESDNEAIGKLAADHLVERGYRNFAWAPFANDAQNIARGESFRKRLAEYGNSAVQLSAAHIREGGAWVEHWESRRLQILQEIASLPKGTGIFAYNDCVAIDVLRVCIEAGIRIPGDIAMLGVDNDTALSQLTSVTLSSIDLNFEEMGYQAASALNRLLSTPSAPPETIKVLPRALVPRLSSGTLYVDNERVRRATAYIQENYMNPTLGVIDVAKALGLSRRTLERHFRLELGMSIAEQIAATRMQEAVRILQRHERAKMADVTNLVGFGRQENFFRTFRRHFGMTPKAYKIQMAKPRSPAVNTL